MAIENAIHTKTVPQPFDVALTLLRQALRMSGLSVEGEVDLSGDLGHQLAACAQKCVLLMVDCPLLLFEAVALDRSAGAFIPLHVVVTGNQHSTCVQWAHPSVGLGLRMSPAFHRAVNAMVARLDQVLEGADPSKSRLRSPGH